MKQAICHYSFHRRFSDEKWDLDRLAEEVKKLGVDAIDFHAGYIGDPATAAARIQKALSDHDLVLSGLSMSNDFNKLDRDALNEEIKTVKTWLRVAAEVQAPVSRVFGGHLRREQRLNAEAKEAGRQCILSALQEVVEEAGRLGVVLAIENHGGLPCTGEEQVDVIETINSPFLKATVDVGNYMQCGQEGHVGTALAAAHAAYVHLKDFRKVSDESLPWGWKVETATVGEGDVDIPACLRALQDAGYDGFVALEYEGREDERTGVPKSVNCMKQRVQELQSGV